MNVLSLFDGISCGQVALNRLGIKYDKYFASEIDKYAIQVTQKNYPDTIQLGDINLWSGWKLPKIDLLIGGSPCQGFSTAGNGLNFADPRSKLFYRFVGALRKFKPKYFLMENVKMKKEWQDIMSGYLGVEPVEINSSLVSAQSRKRLYWTNIPNVTQPDDKGIVLRDIIEHGFVDRDKSHCVTASYFKGPTLNDYFKKSRNQLVFEDVSCARVVGRRINSDGIRDDYDKDIPIEQYLEKRKDNKSGTITTVQKDNILVFEKGHGNNKGGFTERTKFATLRQCTKDNYAIFDKVNKVVQVNPSKEAGGKQPYMQNRVYSAIGKSPALTSFSSRLNVGDMKYWRKLTPVECERLQTLDDNYTDKGISNTQRYKALGNCWTVDVICHIFKNMEL